MDKATRLKNFGEVEVYKHKNWYQYLMIRQNPDGTVDALHPAIIGIDDRLAGVIRVKWSSRKALVDALKTVQNIDIEDANESKEDKELLA